MGVSFFEISARILSKTGKVVLPGGAHLFRYVGLLCIPTLAAIYFFLSQAPLPVDLRGCLYWLSLPTYYVFILLIFSVLCWPFALIPKVRLLIPLLGGLWMILLTTDIIVFNVYRFHINLFFIQMFFLDFKGLGLPWFLQMYAAVSVLILFIASYGMWQIAVRRPAISKTRSALGVALSVLVFACNQSIHAWASYFYRSEITAYSNYLPFYFPVQDPKGVTWLADTLPSVFPPVDGHLTSTIVPEKRFIRYPLGEVKCESKTLPHIVMIVVESWQADMLNPDVMPQTFEFANTAWQFKNHVSGGNSTIPGVFSLMTGLHASYYEAFRTQSLLNRSFFTETLHKQGYQSRVFTNSSFNNFALRPLIFSRVSDENYVSAVKQPLDQGDLEIVQSWQSAAQMKLSQPRFDFIFLSSPHYPYSYPQAFNRFSPTSSNKSEHFLRRDTNPQPLKNDYRNSLFFVDSLLGQLVQTLKKSPDWDNTWLLIAGDHGEEFNDNGLKYWGHASNFSRWQTHVPLIIKPAGSFKPLQFERYSTHQDIVPTLLTRAVGCEERDTGKYANGVLLDQLPEERLTMIGSYVSSAYWVNGAVQDKLLGNLHYDWHDMRINRPDINSRDILQLIEQESRFFAR